jgi:hypothetical protein
MDLRRRHGVVQELRAAARNIQRRLKNEQQRHHRETARRARVLPPSVHRVCRILARLVEEPVNLIATYILQHYPAALADESAQPCLPRALDMARNFLQDLRWPDPEVDAPLAMNSPAVRLSRKRALNHLHEAELAKWTATMNVQQRMAPTSTLLTRRWADLSSPSATAAAGARSFRHLHPRTKRKRLGAWKKRWGFRYGKMAIRDVFADGELQAKAALPHRTYFRFVFFFCAAEKISC